ncbi:MAG: hypothetical protein E7402_01515 [Ruminococcaceae bacterium]|nr:hypothetical protein [Oscillospiraceae bacterium]
MTSKTFLPKRGLVRYQLKSFWWLSALYGLLLFLFGPFTLLNEDKQWLLRTVLRRPEQAGQELYSQFAVLMLLLGSAVLIGVFVFSYMQKVRSATLFHAMPVTRAQLYISTLFSGFLLLCMPILANALVLLLMSLFGGYGPIIPPIVILDWVAGQFITGTAVLFFTIFIGILTGSSVGQFVFTFAVCFIPIGMLGLISFLLDGWLFGFTAEGIAPTLEFALQLQPIYFPQFFGAASMDTWITFLHLGYVFIFGILGFWLYQKRDVERAGDVAAFRFIRPVFLYAVTFAVMLAGTGLVLAISGHDTNRPNAFVLLLFALLGYAVAKMLLTKSFRILPYYKGYLAFAALVLLMFFAVDANVIGFGKTVPVASEIDKAYIGGYYRAYWMNAQSFGHDNIAVFKEAEGIDQVLALQEEAIAAGTAKETVEGEHKQTVYFSYLMQSGRLVTRAYKLETKRLYELFGTDAAKDSMYPYFRTMPEKIRYISLPDVGADVYGEKKQALVACVQEDLSRLSYEEIQGYMNDGWVAETEVAIADKEVMEERLAIRALEVHVEDESEEDGESSQLQTVTKGDVAYWFSLNHNFTRTYEWLRANGYMRG